MQNSWQTTWKAGGVTVSYLVNILDHAGDKIAVIPSWRTLSLELSINNFSTHTLSLDLDDSARQYFAKDRFVQVMRADIANGLDWYQEYIGFHRTPSHQITEAHNKIWTSYGRSLEDLLNRRSDLHRADIAARYDGPADDMMKKLVRENCGPLATLAGSNRLRDANFPLFEVEADTSQAGNWKGSRAYKNVLEIAKEISLASSVDFRVDLLSNPFGFRFVTRYPQLGNVVNLRFGPEYGNVANPQYTASATEEVNVVVVAGSGVTVARDIEIVQSVAVLESPWNDAEIVRDARNEDSTDALIAVGNAELAKLAERESFVFQLIQTPVTMYGRDYRMGDIITVRFGDIVRTKKIVGVRINVSRDSHEQITCDFSDTESPSEAKLIRTISERLHALEHSGEI
jgi:hypothetical protein